MGLDNGILITSHKRKITREMLPKELIYPSNGDYFEDGIEILYWRKNWGLRNKILDLDLLIDENNDYIIDTPSQVFEIIKIISSFLDKETWEKKADSIWEYQEVLPILQENIINLAIIAAYMKNNQDVYLKFYDSY